MQNIRRVALGQTQESAAAFRTRLRLFGLLASLVPLFAGLQYIVREAVPRVEIRLVSQDVQASVPVLVPVEVPVDRIVERIVYVQVDRADAVPQRNAPAGLPEAVFQPAEPVVLPPAPTSESRDQSQPIEPLTLAGAEIANVDVVAAAPAAEAALVAAPAPVIIATGTYRPQPVVTAARASAPVPVAAAAPEAEVFDSDAAVIADAVQAEDTSDIDLIAEEPAGEFYADESVEYQPVVEYHAVSVTGTDDGMMLVSVQSEPAVRERQHTPVDEAFEAPAAEDVAEATEPEVADDPAPVAEKSSEDAADDVALFDDADEAPAVPSGPGFAVSAGGIMVEGVHGQ